MMNMKIFVITLKCQIGLLVLIKGTNKHPMWVEGNVGHSRKNKAVRRL